MNPTIRKYSRKQIASAASLIALTVVTIVLGAAFLSPYGFFGLHLPPLRQCPSDAKPFRNTSLLSNTVFHLAPGATASICLTMSLSGRLPPWGLDLAPSLLLVTTRQSGTSMSACTTSGTNCGGVSTSASPGRAFFPFGQLSVVATINAPSGSTGGLFDLWFDACSGGQVMWVRVGELNQSSPLASRPLSLCPSSSFHVSLTFNSYVGLVPTSENMTAQVLF